MAWSQIGQNRDNGSGSSDLVSLDGQKRLRLMLPPEGPISNWFYSISTPADDYRTWLSPSTQEDFFSKNRRVFGLRPTHASLAWDYDEGAVRILEAGNQIWEAIKTLNDAGKDLNGRDIMITKAGSGRSTEYKVVDMDPTPLNVDLATQAQPDINARYATPPTYEAVIEDLRTMGFTHPEQIFTTREIGIDEAKATVVPFGKYKDKTLNEVYTLESSYVLYLATKIDREDIKQPARVVANALLGTQLEVDGMAPAMDELTFVAPAQEGQQQQQQNQQQGQGQTPPPPAPPAGGGLQRPTNPQFIHTQPDGKELWWIDNEWKEGVVTPPAPPAPPVPPAAPQTPPPAQNQTPPPAAPPAGGIDVEALKAQINTKFEQDAKYKDFMQIITVMKQATAPNEKTSINEFTPEEVQKLAGLVL